MQLLEPSSLLFIIVALVISLCKCSWEVFVKGLITLLFPSCEPTTTVAENRNTFYNKYYILHNILTITIELQTLLLLLATNVETSV